MNEIKRYGNDLRYFTFGVVTKVAESFTVCSEQMDRTLPEA